jgi:DNA-binding MarR family transcriptional regulator
MVDSDKLIDLFYENIKGLFFPESWLQMDLKFSKSEIFAMLLIDKRGEITMTEAAEYINAPMSTANGIIERLVKKGYILRERSDTDRRIVVLRLSAEGSQMIGALKELVTGYLRIALEELSEDEVQTMIGIILKVVQSFRSRLRTEQLPEANKIKNIAIE